MSVTYVKGNSPLGTLGSLTLLGGTLTGNPLLTGLGTGMTAANGLINGGSNNIPQNVNTLQQALQGILGWVNPASGNIATSATRIKDIADSVYGKTYGGLK